MNQLRQFKMLQWLRFALILVGSSGDQVGVHFSTWGVFFRFSLP